jgi:hypothetical protein
MFLPVERSITVSAPQRVAQVIFSTSSWIDELTAELPIFALIFQKIAADDHRLGFRMVDVGRNDRAAARDFGANELRRDEIGDRRAEALTRMLARHQLGQRAQRLLAFQVLADRDEFHLGRDDSAPRVMHLRHVATEIVAGLGAARLTLEVEAHARELGVGKTRPAIGGSEAVELGAVATLFDPARAQRRQAGADVDVRRRVRVRPRRVIDGERRIDFGPERRRRVGLRDLAHRYAHVGPRALDVDLAGIRQRLYGRVVDVRVAGEKLVVGVHDAPLQRRIERAGERYESEARFPAPALSAQVPRV